MLNYMSNTMGQRFKDLRKKSNLTQEDIAEKTGLTITYISKFESDFYKNPRKTTIDALAKALGVHPSKIAYEENKKKGQNENIEAKKREYVPLAGFVDTENPDHSIKWSKDSLPTNSPLKTIAWLNEIKDPDTYALSIEDDSMPFFDKVDWIILVEPNAKVESEDPVLVRTKDGQVLFRKVYFNNDLFTLTASNPKYPPLILRKKEIVSMQRVSGMISKDWV